MLGAARLLGARAAGSASGESSAAVGGRPRPRPTRGLGGTSAGARPSWARIWARRFWASAFIDACSISSMCDSTEVDWSSAMPRALA